MVRGRQGCPKVGDIEARKNTVGAQQAFIQRLARVPTAQWLIADGTSLLDPCHDRQHFEKQLAEADLPAGPGQRAVLTDSLTSGLAHQLDGRNVAGLQRNQVAPGHIDRAQEAQSVALRVSGGQAVDTRRLVLGQNKVRQQEQRAAQT